MIVKLEAESGPSKDRCEPGSVNIPVAKWPKSAVSTSADPGAVATEVVDRFNAALKAGDTKAVGELFLEDGYWRDHLANSWNLRTIKGAQNVTDYLIKESQLISVALDKSTAVRSPMFAAFDGVGEVKGVQSFLNFESKVGSGTGLVRLAEQDGQWKIFTLFTTLREIKGSEERINGHRTKGAEHGGKPGRKNWQERREAEQRYEGNEPTVLVLGKQQSRSLMQHTRTDH